MQTPFRKELEVIINRHSQENGSDTPDFILADFLADQLRTFDAAVLARETFYGRTRAPSPQAELRFPGGDASDKSATTRKTSELISHIAERAHKDIACVTSACMDQLSNTPAHARR